jgi:uncharacterized membrane protein
MKAPHSITIHAPLHKVFLAAADLTRWPEFLPHYRHNRFLSQTPSGGVVEMSCWHAGLPVTWVSEFRIDARGRELRFTHLRSTLNAISGADTVWSFVESPEGSVEVTVQHHHAAGWPIVGRLAPNKTLGRLLLQRITGKTLAGLKRKVEAQQHAEKNRSPSRPRSKKAASSPTPPRKRVAKSAARTKSLRKRK